MRAFRKAVMAGLVIAAGILDVLDGKLARLTQSASGGFHLVVLETVDTDDPQQWRSGLQGVNDRWIVPALAAIKAGTLDRLTLVTGNGTDFTLTPSASKRWWRRTKKLHDSFLA